jgi:hypothetical protein
LPYLLKTVTPNPFPRLRHKSGAAPLINYVNYSVSWRRHSFKAGYEYQAIDTADNAAYPKYGADIYSGFFSNPTSAAPSPLQQQIFSVADFMFGARLIYWMNNNAIPHLRLRMYFAYLQDNWRVNNRLTLNLGVRYEFATPVWERDNNLSNFDPATNKLILATRGSLYDRALVHPDLRNWAPRAGLAYQLGSRTVIRAGYGINYVHFNRLNVNSQLAYNGPAVVSQQIAQVPAQGICTAVAAPAGTCFRPTYLGYPPDFATPANYNPVTSQVDYIAADYRSPYVQSWHFTVQQQVAKDTLLDIAYVGNHSAGLPLLADRNQALPNLPGQTLAVQARRPIPAFNTILQTLNAGFSSYHSLQIKLQKRLSDGISFLNSFTWSKTIDNLPDILDQPVAGQPFANYYNLRADRGLSGLDRPFLNTTSILYQVPAGKGRRYNVHGAMLDAMVGGWDIDLINTLTSGPTLDVTYSPVTAAQGNANLLPRPNLAGNPVTAEGQRTIANYLNAAAFSVPPITQPFGNAGRNVARGYAFYELDFGLHKNFLYRSKRRICNFELRLSICSIRRISRRPTPISAARRSDRLRRRRPRDKYSWRRKWFSKAAS